MTLREVSAEPPGAPAQIDGDGELVFLYEIE